MIYNRLYISIYLIICVDFVCISQTYILDGTTSGTTVNTCSGDFYDSSGPTGRYRNNENYSITFCSDNGGAIVFDFQAWDVEGHPTCNYDYLRIYDGTSTSDPLIGEYCTNSPGIIVSSDTCIHFVWSSDFSVRRPGWEASISCETPPADSLCTYEDQFGTVSYSNSDGSQSWSSEPWIETGDANGPNGISVCCTSGYKIYVAQSGNYGYSACPNGNNCLYFDLFASSDNDNVTRSMDLSGGSNVTVSYDYNGDFFDTNDEVQFQIRSSGGSWTTLRTYSDNTSSSENNINIDAHISSDTEVRFIAIDASYGDFAIDNFIVEYICNTDKKKIRLNPFVAIRLDRT